MINEDELQRRVERGEVANDVDKKAYEVVFNALKKEPHYSLSPRFADRIVEIAARQKSDSASAELIWLGVGIFLLFVALIVALSKITLPSDLGFLSAMNSYAGLFIFGIVFIGLLHWIDRKFIQHRQAV